MHRAPGHARGNQQRDIFGIGRRLHPESAADVLAEHAELLGLEAHDRDRLIAHRIGALGAGAQRVGVIGGVVARGAAARLHRGDDQPLIDDLHARDVIGFGKHLLHVAQLCLLVRHQPFERGVARRIRPELRRPRGDRLFDIDDRRKLIVFDRDQLGGVHRGFARIAHHHGDAFTDMQDAIGSEHRPERANELRAVAAAQFRMPAHVADVGGFHILAGQHRDNAGRGARTRGVDRANARAGMRRAHEHRVGLVRLRGIVDESPLAGDQRAVLDAQPALAVMILRRMNVHCGFRKWGHHGGITGTAVWGGASVRALNYRFAAS